MNYMHVNYLVVVYVEFESFRMIDEIRTIQLFEIVTRAKRIEIFYKELNIGVL